MATDQKVVRATVRLARVRLQQAQDELGAILKGLDEGEHLKARLDETDGYINAARKLLDEMRPGESVDA